MKYLSIVGEFIKTHIATTVITTATIGTLVATPIVINNMQPKQPVENPPVVEEPENNQEDIITKCDDGYVLQDNECIKIEDEPVTNENNTPKPDNSNNKPNNENTNKPSNEVKCTTIDCKFTEKNKTLYYNGQKLFGIVKFERLTYIGTDDGWEYNKSLLLSLSSEEKKYVLDNYFSKEPFCVKGYDRAEPSCLKDNSLEVNLSKQAMWFKETGVSHKYYDVQKAEICVAYKKGEDLPHKEQFQKWRLDEEGGLDNLCGTDKDAEYWSRWVEIRKQDLEDTKKDQQTYEKHLKAYQDTRSILQQ